MKRSRSASEKWLEADREYFIKIDHEGYTPKELKVETDVDVNLGDILLERD